MRDKPIQPERPDSPQRNLPDGSRTTEPRSTGEVDQMAVATVIPAVRSEDPESDTGSQHEELSGQARFLDATMRIAVRHDAKCIEAEDAVYRLLGLRGDGRSGRIEINSLDAEEAFNAYYYDSIEICAAIAAAAMRRIPPSYFARNLANAGAVEELSGADLEDFLGPIFEESGIGHRFVLSGKLIALAALAFAVPVLSIVSSRFAA